MAGRNLRAAVVGASTLLGKELTEELNRSKNVVWDLTLLDTADASGQIAAAGDEALVIQPISAEAFAGMDVAFFAGDKATALEFWKSAHAAGASVVDLTGSLEGQPQVLVRAPLLSEESTLDQATVAVVSAHPAAVMLALACARLSTLGMKRFAATVLQPASEFGDAGVEEIHQQTVGLLTFKPLKKDLYDAQVAFNVVASLGDAAKIDLDLMSARITCHLRQLVGGSAADATTLQVLHVPVFHGYTASVFVEFEAGIQESSLRAVLHGAGLRLAEDISPSNEHVAGTDEVLVSVKGTGSNEGTAFWLWMAADNTRLAAKNAAACALELTASRQGSGVHSVGAPSSDVRVN